MKWAIIIVASAAAGIAWHLLEEWVEKMKIEKQIQERMNGDPKSYV